jgi:hypothetical protein
MFEEFHDEYSSLDALFKEIQKIRSRFDDDRKFHFTDISGRTWTRFDTATRSAVEASVDALKHKFPNIFRRPLCCKLAIIFYPENLDRSLYGGAEEKEKALRQDETLLRILLKGAVHYLYSDTREVTVVDLVCDGQPNHRPLDMQRVVWQIEVDELSGRTPLREYATFSPDAGITHLPSTHRDYEQDTEEYVHANMLQLADLLLGSVIRSCYVGCTDHPTVPCRGDKVSAKKDVVAYPVKEMLQKMDRGYGFRHSGHFGAFSISHFEIEDDEILFRKVHPKDIKTDGENLQLSFFE